MQLAKPDNYVNDKKIEVRKLKAVEPFDRSLVLLDTKATLDCIRKVERFVRSSQEYRQYIAYLRKEIDMTMCSFFNKITTKGARKVSIEVHHEPFTLFDITQIVVAKWVQQQKPINILLIAEEVAKIHYQGRVGLIPLSLTVHELVHEGKIFIPLQNVYGNYVDFVKEYSDYIPEETLAVLEAKLGFSKKMTKEDFSILETKYIYLEVEGFSFPHMVEKK